jgi:Na+-translocating ferredoxin:NAD+ oxidoreductase RnfG subunit
VPLRRALIGLFLVLSATFAGGEDIYLTLEEAPAAVFPDADRFVAREVVSTPALRAGVAGKLDRMRPTVWEKVYPVFAAYRGEETIGDAVIVEEIGKHREITFIVGVTTAGEVAGVAIMAYREPYGGEVRSRRFLRQFDGKRIDDPLVPSRDIRNITGATLSAKAIGRGIKKAIAVLEISRENEHAHRERER